METKRTLTPIIFSGKMELLDWIITPDGYFNWNSQPPINSDFSFRLVALKKQFSNPVPKIDFLISHHFNDIVGLKKGEKENILTAFRIFYDAYITIFSNSNFSIQEKIDKLTELNTNERLKILAEQIWFTTHFNGFENNINEVNARNNVFVLCQLYLKAIDIVDEALRELQDKKLLYVGNLEKPFFSEKIMKDLYKLVGTQLGDAPETWKRRFIDNDEKINIPFPNIEEKATPESKKRLLIAMMSLIDDKNKKQKFIKTNFDIYALNKWGYKSFRQTGKANYFSMKNQRHSKWEEIEKLL